MWTAEVGGVPRTSKVRLPHSTGGRRQSIGRGRREEKRGGAVDCKFQVPDDVDLGKTNRSTTNPSQVPTVLQKTKQAIFRPFILRPM